MTSGTHQPIKHHYVPRFYLEQWTGADGKLCMTTRIGERLIESRLAPRSTGFQERLYSFKDEPFIRNVEPHVIETKILSSIDDAGARAHRRLLNEGPTGMSDAERRAWAMFLNAMFERDPRRIRDSEAKVQQIAADVLKETLDTATDEEQRAWLTRVVGRLDVPAGSSNIVLKGMVDDIHDTNVLEYLESMWWVVFAMPPELELHTSNCPLVVNAGRQRTPIDVAWIPLSPSKLFALLPKSWLPQDGREICQETEEFFRMLVVYHNLILLLEEPERLYSKRKLNEDERRAAARLLRCMGRS